MSKEIVLFQKEELTFKEKFYTLMDLLINNQNDSTLESLIFISISYIQIISSFFAKQIGVFNPETSKSDKILNYIERIIRLKDLFFNYRGGFLTLEYALFIIIILCICHFLITLIRVRRKEFYSYNKMFINYYLQFFLYIAYNVIFDLCFSNFCFGSDEYNPHFNNIKCSITDNIPAVTISIIFIILSFVLYMFIQIYYSDSFYLSNSFYSKMSCEYDFYIGFNSFAHSLLLIQAKYLTKEIFLVYNIIVSCVLMYYYVEHLLFYHKIANNVVGIYHTLYAWTSIFSFIFCFIHFEEKGVMYILTSIIACYFYMNYKAKLVHLIFVELPFTKIENKFYLLYYFKVLIDKIVKAEESPEEKSVLSGIIHMHMVECPNPACLTKTKDPIYLPIGNKWSDRSKKAIDDDVFLKNLIIVIMNYFLSKHGCTVDMFLNLSLYYLKVIGNYCQALYYFKQLFELKLSLKEEFTLTRLNIEISKSLLEKHKPPNEQNVTLENLDVTMYYKYDSLSQNFIDEISNDSHLSLDFWKIFRTSLRDPTKKVDFNKVFELTDKIRVTKKNIEIMWNQLLEIYGGVNDYFEFYMIYVEQINDDDLKKRDLESLKRKNDNYSDHIGQNYYSVLFNKETSIIVANGDKGNEGIIELSNKEIENIFKYKPLDLKGVNLTVLMPKLFSKNHARYMERYFKVGEKRVVDKMGLKMYGKDKNNSIVKIKINIKLFPIINENIFFVGLILKENVDDIIFMDEQFNIQGMSSKLLKIINIDNKFLFQENDIPFYVICKKFVNFYRLFLNNKTNETPEEEKDNEEISESERKPKKKKKNVDKNDTNENSIEINENVELEYEIKLPQFLIDYSDKTNKKDNKGFKLQSLSVKGTKEIEESLENDNDDETTHLIEESKIKEPENNSNYKTDSIFQSKINKLNSLVSPSGTFDNPTPEGETPTPAGMTPTPNENNTPVPINENKKKEESNKLSEEEALYKKRIQEYKKLFEEEKYSELEDLIDNCNKDSLSSEFKFNFTFDRIKYGDNNSAYIVRCIDNKNDAGKSLEDSGEDFDPKSMKYKKEKSQAIKPLYELLEDEKKEILELPDKFIKLSLENKKFQKLLQQCKNDIACMSKAHGQKKDEILEDENSSQSSQTGFDSGLVKKNRIEEIRSNLLSNISNFYTLKYLRLLIAFLALITLVFCITYILLFSNIYNSLKDSSSINVNLFQTTLWTTELVSIFISLRALFEKATNITKVNYTFLNYQFGNITDNQSYYREMVSTAKQLYHNISYVYGYLEMDIPKYLTEKELNKYFWDRLNVTYYYNTSKKDNETFPMSIAQVLSNSHSYLYNSIYNSTYYDSISLYNNDTHFFSFEYMTHLIIENSYINLIPNEYIKILNIPVILSNYNSNEKKPIIIIIVVYACIIIIVCISYFFLIHLTNKSMTDGLEKVTKIRLEKVEETIKKIETFNANLKKFRDKDSKASNNENKENSEASENQKNKGTIDNDGSINLGQNQNKKITDTSLVGSNGFNTDVKKFIPLNVLNKSFFHAIFIFCLLCGILIPTYIYSNKMVANTNKLILVQDYIFGKLITSSSNTVKIKCFISGCEAEDNLDFSNIVNMDLIQEVIKGINLFSEVNEFYNNKFLLDACAASMHKHLNMTRYNECLNETLILSANNTDNFIKLIEDLVENIRKEYNMNANSSDFHPIELFSSTYFQQVEEIFYKYIINVGNIFADLVIHNLSDFLFTSKMVILILVCCLGVIMLIYCVFYILVYMKNLVHYLSVSRCVMKIIPTTVIIATQELEAWIENKY